MITHGGNRHLIRGDILRRSIYSLGEGDITVDEYDLRQLCDITTVEPIEIDTKRQAMQHAKQRATHVAVGAVAGVAIDSLQPGDSIMDGLLLGALAGWLFSPSKKEPVAHLVLHFIDGETLPVVVDRTALTSLCALVEANRKADRSFDGPAHTTRKLSPSEAEDLRYRSARHKGINVAMIVFSISLLVLAYVFSPPDPGHNAMFVEEMSKAFASAGQAFLFSVVLGMLAGCMGGFVHLLNTRRSALE